MEHKLLLGGERPWPLLAPALNWRSRLLKCNWHLVPLNFLLNPV